jgi:hypothetical protein
MLARAGEGLAWLAGGAGAVGLLMGDGARLAEAWGSLATRLATGVTAEGVALARLRVAELRRTAIQALCGDGLGHLEALATAPLALIERRLGGVRLARKVREAARKTMRGRQGTPPNFQISNFKSQISNFKADAAPATPLPLEIDLQSPGVIRAAGREVRLTPLSFDLLVSLAERPGKVMSREALYFRLWPEGGPEDQQLDAHRRRLARELRAVFGAEAPRLIEVVRGLGFRLNLPQHHVHLQRA